MRLILNIIAICLISTIVQAQQSDHEIVEYYEKTRKSLVNKMLSAGSVTDYQRIVQEIDTLMNINEKHASILQYALYPRVPNEELAAMDFHAKRYHAFYVMLESSQNRLTELHSELRKAKEEVEVLTKKNSLHLGRLSDLREQNNELSNRLRAYSDLVSSREELIFLMVDSLLMYSQPLLNVSSLSTYREGNYPPIDISKDPLQVIENVLDGELEVLSEERIYLEAGDLLHSYARYKELNERWNRVRSAFARSYSVSSEDLRNIDQMFRDLRELSGDHFWLRVQSQLGERGFDVRIINDQNTFMNWLDDRINEWQNEQGSGFALSDQMGSMMIFHEYWQQHFDGEWRTNLINSELMTERDLLRISTSVDQMAFESRPLPTWILLLSIFCGVSVTAFVLVLVRANTL